MILIDADTNEQAPAPTSQSVRISGFLPSEQLNDVQIKVTHTTADGACSKDDMLELTAILATLTLRTMDPNANPPEMWSDDNEVNEQLFIVLGAPQLGAEQPGNPINALGFFKGIEIQAAITPCVAGLTSQFDFLRARQGQTPIVVNNVLTLDNSCAPPNSWCGDDPIDQDEYLVTAAPNNWNLYSVDGPGFATGILAIWNLFDCDEDTPANLINSPIWNTQTFVELLMVDGFRASDLLIWHASTEIACGQDPQGNRMWLETNAAVPNNAGNAMGTGSHPAFPPPNFSMLSSAFEEIESAQPEPQDSLPGWMAEAQTRFDRINELNKRRWRARIEDHDMSIVDIMDRLRAPETANSSFETVGLAFTYEQMGRMDDVGRETMATLLNAEMQRPTSPRSLNAAMHLAGGFRLESCIQMLIERINELHNQNNLANFDNTPPAVRALVLIGEPSVGPILERVSTADEKEWKAMRAALRGIDRKSLLVRQAMRTLLDAQRLLQPAVNDDEKAQRELIEKRLTEFLKTREPRRPKPQPAPEARIHVESDPESSPASNF